MLSSPQKKILSHSLKLAVSMLLFYALYRQLFGKLNGDQLIQVFSQSRPAKSHAYILAAILLMPFNWILEAHKWRRLILQLANYPFSNALRGVLLGISVSLMTPNRVGEFGGRILVLKPEHRIEGVALTLTSSLSQMLATLLMGIIGLVAFINYTKAENPLLIYACAFSAVCALIGLFTFFNISKVIPLLRRIKRLQAQLVKLKALPTLSKSLLAEILGIAITRYLLFALQFYCLLTALGVGLSPYQAAISISSIYLFQTLIPSIAITHLSIRGSIVLYFLTYFSANQIGILASILAIWVLNLGIPALFGLLVLLQINIFKNED